MVEPNISQSADLERPTPTVGAEHALSLALTTVATLQKAARSQSTVMIPGELPARMASLKRTRE